jgi:uncharacterized BrkB/YihY/UPF0761 family membrane protein
LAARASRVLPRDLHDELVQLILRTKRDSPLLITGSILSMLWVSSGAVGVLQRCLTRLLGLPGAGIVRGRLRNLRIAAALTTLIVLMVLVASAGTGIARRLQVNSLLLRLAVPLLSIAITVLICAAVYRSQALPRRVRLAARSRRNRAGGCRPPVGTPTCSMTGVCAHHTRSAYRSVGGTVRPEETADV